MNQRVLFIFFLLCCVRMLSYAQTQTLTGVVYNADSGQPLPGATVQTEQSKLTAKTDEKGQFELRISTTETAIEVSSVGYQKQRVLIEGRSVFRINLLVDEEQLEEVVVTGYQTERKRDLTGAVSVVRTKDIADIPTGNVMSTLQGRVPGLIVNTDGTPGGVGTGVNVRGITTINNSTPLYVIDGVQTRDNIATLLNANDVESIQVLKDAAAASIYGAQAANGVIIITTKKGRRNETRVNFDAQLTAQTFHTGINMLNAQQWGEVYWKAYQNDGVKPVHDLYGNGDLPVIPEYIDLNNTIKSGNTNWADEVYNTALLQNYNVSVFKGTEAGSTTFSLNYFDQDGLVRHTNMTRFNARLNSDYSLLNNRLRIGENLNVSKWGEKLKPDGIEELTISQHPIIPVYDINGGYAGPTQGVGDKPNPIRLLDQQRDNRSNQWRIFGNIFGEVEPLENFVIRTNFGLNYRNGFYSNFEPKWSEGDRTVDINNLSAGANYDLEWIWSNTAAYSMTKNSHSLNVLAGMESKETTGEWLDASRRGYLIEALEYRYLDAGEGRQTNGGSASRTAMISYFGRFNYAYQDKYLLSGTIRRDASSRFGQNNNAGVFPAVAAAWRLSEESFLEDVPFISDLKLRASWGQNGNDLMDNEAIYTKYRTDLNQAGYDIGGINTGVIPTGIIRDRSGNPNVRWEKTTQSNVGLDFSVLSNRLSGTIDYFWKETTDMLIDRPYIAIIGEGGYMAYNGAGLKNNGIEGAITWRSTVNNDFSYDITFTATAYRNRITSLPEDIYYTWGGGNGRDISIVGQPLGSWLGLRTDGLYRTTDELDNDITQPGKGLGRIRYVDTNGDQTINDDDRVWLGSDQPRFIGGLNASVQYKSFDFNFFLTGMVRDAWNNARFYTDFFQLWTGNHGTRLLDAWNPDENYNSNIPALTAVNLNDEGRASDYFIENGSYIRMKNMVLGYTLPTPLSDRLKMKNMRVYLQGQNLFTITGYTGADPEGLGYPYPMPRTYTFGINVGF